MASSNKVSTSVGESKSSNLNIGIKNTDMPEAMQQDAADIAKFAFEKYAYERDIASHIKAHFDKKYPPTWHCVVGRHFGSFVTHLAKHFIYFYIGQHAILLYKSG